MGGAQSSKSVFKPVENAPDRNILLKTKLNPEDIELVFDSLELFMGYTDRGIYRRKTKWL